MVWLKMPNERPCGTCGGVVEHWVLLQGDGPRVAEAIFCPVCYPVWLHVTGAGTNRSLRSWGEQ